MGYLIKNTKPIALFLLLTWLFTLSAAGPLSAAEKSSADPEPHEVRAQIESAVLRLAKGEFREALLILRKAEESAPENVDIANFIGLAYYGMREYDQAAESYRRALALNPGRSDVRNSFGLVRLAQRNYDLAMAEFEACLGDQNYKKKHLPLCNIALIHMEQGRDDPALAALNRAMELAPNYAKSYYLTGRLYKKQGDCRRALGFLKTAVRLDPGNAEAFKALSDCQTDLAVTDVFENSPQ